MLNLKRELLLGDWTLFSHGLRDFGEDSQAASLEVLASVFVFVVSDNVLALLDHVFVRVTVYLILEGYQYWVRNGHAFVGWSNGLTIAWGRTSTHRCI